jgi:hypothetical protein
MSKARFFRGALFLALFTALAMGASAQITLSGGFALSSMSAEIGSTSIDGGIGLGVNIYGDYLLPISIPLSLGIEVGYDTASIEDDGIEVTGSAIPLLIRVAYHFDLMTKLDLYVVGKIGYVLGFGEAMGESQSGFNGIGIGFDVGAAYYFIPRLGVFAELGFDRYNLEKTVSGTKVEAPFTRFITVGISAKF